MYLGFLLVSRTIC